MAVDNASGGESSPDRTGDAVADASVEHGFRAPARRRKPVYIAAAAVFLVVAVLIYFMAKPDTDRLAASHVDAARTALSEGDVSVDVLRVVVASLNSALELAPQHPDALEAVRSLQDRVRRQLEGGIARGELAGAEAMLGAARMAWPDAAEFDAAGDLHYRLEQALEAQALQAEVRDLLARAKRQLRDGDDQSVESLARALGELRAALDTDPAAGREVHESVRGEILETTRGVLATEGPLQAQQLLNALGDDWEDDTEVGRLRDEVRDQLAELDRSRRLRELLDEAERSLRADRLTTPAGDNAVEYYRQALVLEADNDRALRGLASVAERYGEMIDKAVEDRSVVSARRYLASLTQLAPEHPRLGEFARRIDDVATVQAEAVQKADGDATETEEQQPAPPKETVPDDPEGRLWYLVKDGCEETEIRRYIDTYPEGRYVDQAWKRIAECLAAR